MMSSSENFESCILEKQEKEEVLSLLGEAYVPREPVSLGIHATFDDLKPFLDNVVDACLDTAASVGMRDKTTGKLVGVMLNFIITSPDEILIQLGGYPKEKSNLYCSVVEPLCFDINVLRDFGKKKQFELYILTTHPDYSGKGLAKEIVRVSEEKAKALGCDVLSIQASNPITKIIAIKRGFKPIKTYDVATFKSKEGKQLLDLSNMNGTTQFTYLIKDL